VLQIAPNDLDALITLGSIRFELGDSAGGERWLNRALQLSPGNETIEERLAEGLLENRRFGQAAQILSRLPSTPEILQKLAMCIFLEGDRARADAIAEKFFSSAPQADLQTLFHANWLALTGERQRAIHDLESTNPAEANVRVIEWSELAVWQAMGTNFADARKSAALALQQTKPPPVFGTVAMLIARCDEPPDQWKRDVNVSVIQDEQKQILLGYGFFLGGHYTHAAEVWRTILQRSGGADLRARAMLAASLERAGNSAEARKIGVQPFLPELGDLYAAISFGEMRRFLRLGT
jgi:Flp pilus assembly protein TadD